MGLITENRWKSLSRILRYMGFSGCAIVFLTLHSLVIYYSATRPHRPQPDCGWIVPLYWSLSGTSYGTVNENSFLLWLHWWFFPFFMLIGISECIRIYKLKGDH